MSAAGLALAAQAGGKLVEGLGGLFGNMKANEYNQKAINAQKQGLLGAQGIGNAAYDQYIGQESPFASTYGADIEAWRRSMQKPLSELPEYSSQIDVQSQLSPAVDYMQNQARRQIEQSAANAGGLLSGATGIAISNRAQDIADRAYQEAFGRGQTQKEMDINNILQHFQSQRANALQNMQNLGALTQQSGLSRQNMQQAQLDKAGLGMQTQQGLGDLSAQGYAQRGDYLNQQIQGGAKMLGGLMGQGASALGRVGGK